MRARDQCSIFSTDRKFRPDYGLLLELDALTLVDRSYALLLKLIITFGVATENQMMNQQGTTLIPRPCPAFRRLQYVLKATESWAGPGNEAN